MLDYFVILGIYDKVKGELRLMREELSNIERFKGPRERSLQQCKSSLEAMQTTKEGLESELHQELLSSLSVQDQAQVDSLNDDIQKLQKENKDVCQLFAIYFNISINLKSARLCINIGVLVKFFQRVLN